MSKKKAMFFKSGQSVTFITEWTVAASDTITLPLDNGYIYNFTVDYGDGTGPQIVTAYNDINATHTYIDAGSYEVRIKGVCESFRVGNDSSIDTKITDIIQWGDVKFKLVNFWGCSNLTNLTATDIPNFKLCNSLDWLFRACTGLLDVPNINSWEVGHITSFQYTFGSVGAFNMNIGNWDMGSAISTSLMFTQSTGFNNGGSGDIGNWDMSNVTNMSFMFNTCHAFNQDISNWNTSKVTTMNDMFENAFSFNQNLNTVGSSWDVSSVLNFSSMFRDALAFNGTLTDWDTSSATNMGFMFDNADNFNKPINHFDVSNVSTFQDFLRDAQSFNQPLNLWTIRTSGGVNMRQMFMNADAFNQNIGGWNVSEVTNMYGMFLNNGGFNNGGSTLDTWNVGKVTDFSKMFSFATAFNQPIISWNVSSATVALEMFYGASSFNQDLTNWDWTGIVAGLGLRSVFLNATNFNGNVSGWDTSTVTNMRTLFAGSNFNGSVNNWDVGEVTDFTSTFSGCPFNQPLNLWTFKTTGSISAPTMFSNNTVFNQNLSDWDVSRFVNMQAMFNLASAFNNGGSSLINNWDTSNVTTMKNLFSGTNFNQNIPDWNVAKVTTFEQMFYNSPFSGTVTNWVTTAATNMRLIFSNSSFTEDVSHFDMNGVGDAEQMFLGTTYNQDISSWDVSTITDLQQFATTFSTANYDLMLDAWGGQSVQSNVVWGMSTIKYTETQVDSGTTDSTTANKLIESGQNFLTTVSVGDIIRNTTDNTFAEVTAVDSDTQLSLDNDIMVSGENYVIQSSLAAKGRYALINTYNWTITDGGAI